MFERSVFQIGEEVSESESDTPGVIHRPKIPERKTRTQRNKEVVILRHNAFSDRGTATIIGAP